MVKLSEIADAVRSKNAGPYEITFDILFRDAAMYRRVKQTGLIGSALFAELFNVPESDCNFVAFDAGQAFKCTIPRPIVAGHVGDPDVYGAQQHALLLDVDIPLDVQLD